MASILVVIFFVNNGAVRLTSRPDRTTLHKRVFFGIIGDSDSCSYQGRILFSDGDRPWGGAFHRSTLQWPEVLARIRETQVYLGEWSVWGVPRWLSMARVRDGLGLRWRGPRKEDYRHNFAWPSGCSSLLQGGWRQIPRLVDVINENPLRWGRGVVIVRMGINDFGKEALDRLAIDPESIAVRAIMQQCLMHIDESVARIRLINKDTYIVLVGIFDNSNWPPYLKKFCSATEISNIARGLDFFDNGLRQICSSEANMAFFDDRSWFRDHWGGRDSSGNPAYRTVTVGARLHVRNTAGDSPENAVLANGHAGLVWNALWVQSLVDLLRMSFDLPIDKISDKEIGDFVDTTIQ